MDGAPDFFVVSMRIRGDLEIAAQATATFFERLLRAETSDNFILRTGSCLRGQQLCFVTAAETGLAGGLAAVFEIREDAVPTRGSSSLL
jgi:hypothetical protein